MSLCRLVQEREHEPVYVAVIGAGKFATMFLAEARRTPGLRVTAVCVLRPPGPPA
jgi:predicted homoserine dehydrogenase-like protein